MSDEPDDLDMLAAEFALGVLDGETARAVETLAAGSATVAAAVAAWQNRLAPIAALVTPLTPPATLWDRLDQATRPAISPVQPASALPRMTAGPRLDGATREAPRGGVWRNPGFWRATTAASLAVAASLAAVIVTHAPPLQGARYVAALTPLSAPGPAFLARTEPDGSVIVAALTTVTVAPGRDLELWALPEGAQKPISLGILPPAGRRVALSDLPRARTQLLVSLEPAGGSPTGQPTGPVMYGGTLAALD